MTLQECRYCEKLFATFFDNRQLYNSNNSKYFNISGDFNILEKKVSNSRSLYKRVDDIIDYL